MTLHGVSFKQRLRASPRSSPDDAGTTAHIICTGDTWICLTTNMRKARLKLLGAGFMYSAGSSHHQQWWVYRLDPDGGFNMLLLLLAYRRWLTCTLFDLLSFFSSYAYRNQIDCFFDFYKTALENWFGGLVVKEKASWFFTVQIKNFMINTADECANFNYFFQYSSWFEKIFF